MSDSIVTLSDSTFDDFISKAEVPVLVDFWAPWCQPCKMIAPVLQEITEEYGPKIRVAKVNVDENVDIPKKFGIRNIPSLLLFKNGEMVGSKVGAVSKTLLTTFIDSHSH